MKKFIVILSLGLFTLGMTSCEDPIEDVSAVTENVNTGDTSNVDNDSDEDTGGETGHNPKK